MYLYDTNTISELRKRDPNPNVVRFNNRVNANHDTVYLRGCIHKHKFLNN